MLPRQGFRLRVLHDDIERAGRTLRQDQEKASRRRRRSVSVYDYHPPADLLIHRFTAPNLGWLDFVLFNRGFLDGGNPLLSLCPRLPDIIVGPVANDTVGVVLGLLTNGAFGDPSSETAKSIAIAQLRTEKLFDQVFFATQAAVSALTFKEAYVA